MSVQADKYQVGVNVTNAQNFTIQATGDGTLRIFRGGEDSPLSEVLRIEADGQLTSFKGEFAKTGDFKFRQAAAPDPGWIVANGGTIGSTASNATNRAGNDTFNLFVRWWTDYTDAQLPILTSAGAASTRGNSAQADWDANKRLSVFDMTDDRFPVGANGAGTINGTKYADTLKDHTHTVASTAGQSTGGTTGLIITTSGAPQGGFTSSGASGGATKNLPPRLGMLPCYKL